MNSLRTSRECNTSVSEADESFARIQSMREEQKELTGDEYFASVDAELIEMQRLRLHAEAEGRVEDFFVPTEPEPNFVQKALNAAKEFIKY